MIYLSPQRKDRGIAVAMRMEPEPTSNQAIGERLQCLRLALGYEKQTDWIAATGGGLSTQMWNNWEKGRSHISYGCALILVKRWGVDLSWIYQGLTGNMPEALLAKLRAVKPRPFNDGRRRA